MSRFALVVIAVFLVSASQPIEASEACFDAEVMYNDGRIDTVFNVYETLDRGFVRILCYIDGDARPKIPYGEISSVAFARSDREARKIAISITLLDGTIKRGVLWDNDSFFATTRDNAEWRGRIVNLSRLTFIPSASSSDQSEQPPPPQRSGAPRR